jgi:cyclopropane fatty-acyl-phospholipid synthase-like methyltransferase
MLKKLIPYPLQKAIQSTELYSTIDARRLASTSKKLDICAAQFAHLLHNLKPFDLTNKVCLELGSGWVLSHALICYLLGAKKVIATDISSNARPDNLYNAVNKSIIPLIRDILSPFEQHQQLRTRLEHLRSIKTFNFDTLESLGISYTAPIDLVKNQLEEQVDFIFSFSVLEHIPLDDVQTLIENLHSSLKPGGLQAHCIHLEDHKDIPGKPYAFLDASIESYDRKMQTDRGNRIRHSQWLEIFSSLKNSETKELYRWTRNDRSLPMNIDPSIIHNGIEDLSVTHLGLACKCL